MNRKFLGCAFAAGVITAAAAAGAQNPPPQQTRPVTQTAAGQSRMVTVEGCVRRETDLPAYKFDDADLDDFVLTDTKMIKGTAPAPTAAQARPGGRPTGTSGAARSMFEIEGLPDATLETHAGQRVQIDGIFEDLTDDIIDLRGTTIRKVAGDCPAK